MDQSIFGYLATKFGTSPENLATEGLSYILTRSQVANRAFAEYLNRLGLAVPPSLNFATQAGDSDGTIPDLIGSSDSGEELVLCESKFWAGLTENQPVGYLRRLRADAQASLVFIAPRKRFETLWPELIRRCKDAKISVEGQNTQQDARLASVGGCHHLALVSWASMLRCILTTLEDAAEGRLAADVKQLQGLCTHMDESAFLPVRPEELTSNHGTRLSQYNGLVDDVVDRLLSSDLISTKGLRSAPRSGVHLRYFSALPYSGAIQTNVSWWGRHRETPIWLSLWAVEEGKWVHSQTIREKLSRLESEDPPRLIEGAKEFFVPLFIKTLAERDVVVEDLVNQVIEVLDALRGQ